MFFYTKQQYPERIKNYYNKLRSTFTIITLSRTGAFSTILITHSTKIQSSVFIRIRISASNALIIIGFHQKISRFANITSGGTRTALTIAHTRQAISL